MSRRWLVTGCSSGLGRALAEAVVRSGDVVAATARRTETLTDLTETWPDQVVPLRLDLHDEGQCKDAVNAAIERLGGIDVLVNNAGSGLFGAVETVSDEELRDQFETLVVGPWRLVRLVLPQMRRQGSGHIVNVSTLGTRTVLPGLGAYTAGKLALEGMSQTLAVEVAPFGIKVTVVEPGPFSTNYGNALQETAATLPEYAQVSALLGMFRDLEGSPIAGDPAIYARTVQRIVEAQAATPLRIPIGPGAYEMLADGVRGVQEEFNAAQALTEQIAREAALADAAEVVD